MMHTIRPPHTNLQIQTYHIQISAYITIKSDYKVCWHDFKLFVNEKKQFVFLSLIFRSVLKRTFKMQCVLSVYLYIKLQFITSACLILYRISTRSQIYLYTLYGTPWCHWNVLNPLLKTADPTFLNVCFVSANWCCRGVAEWEWRE